MGLPEVDLRCALFTALSHAASLHSWCLAALAVIASMNSMSLSHWMWGSSILSANARELCQPKQAVSPLEGIHQTWEKNGGCVYPRSTRIYSSTGIFQNLWRSGLKRLASLLKGWLRDRPTVKIPGAFFLFLSSFLVSLEGRAGLITREQFADCHICSQHGKPYKKRQLFPALMPRNQAIRMSHSYFALNFEWAHLTF